MSIERVLFLLIYLPEILELMPHEIFSLLPL